MKSAKNAVTEWTKVFPQNASKDNTSSVAFIKVLTTIAISTITYLKEALPPDSYKVENFAGMKLHILKKNCKDGLAQFLTEALVDAFDALDRKYLHKLALCFYQDQCRLGNIIESHVFEYIYHEGRVSMNVCSEGKGVVRRTEKYTFENVREQTIKFLKSCVVMMDSLQNDLSPSYGLSLRLYYYDDAPADYHAPGFAVDEDAEDHLEQFSLEALKVGTLDTSFHKLDLHSYTKVNVVNASQEAIASQYPPVLSNETEKSDSRRDRPRLLCPCSLYGNIQDNDEFLTCHYCNTQQHAACFGVFSDVAALSRHCCASCRDADDTRTPTDLQLVPLAPRERTSMCVFRRALAYCSSLEVVGTRFLMERFGMSKSNAPKLMKMLQRQGIVPQGPEIDFSKPQKINMERLKLIQIKFSNKKEETVADRLIAEIETLSQGSQQPDPIENALGSVEKNDLRNDSNFGRVIDKPTRPAVEDVMLKQYREALVPDEVDFPPPTSGVTKHTYKRKAETTSTANVRNKRTRVWSK